MKRQRFNLSREGFTLIELLAAMAVLAILGLILVQLTNVISRTTNLSNRAIDAAAQARLAFERIGMDLEGLVIRDDTDFQAVNASAASGNNALLFISSVTSAGISSSNNRGVSVIAYRVAAHAYNQNRACLIRFGRPIPWSSTGAVANAGFMGLKNNGLPLLFTDATFSAFLPSSPSDFEVLVAGVIQMVIGFQLYPDNAAVTLANGTAIAHARGQIVYSPPMRSLSSSDGMTTVSLVDLSRVSALVVGVVTLDLNSLNLLDATQVSALGGVFTTPSTDVTPVRAWMATANAAVASATLASVPLPARQSVRVFERFYPITPFGGKTP